MSGFNCESRKTQSLFYSRSLRALLFCSLNFFIGLVSLLTPMTVPAQTQSAQVWQQLFPRQTRAIAFSLPLAMKQNLGLYSDEFALMLVHRDGGDYVLTMLNKTGQVVARETAQVVLDPATKANVVDFNFSLNQLPQNNQVHIRLLENHLAFQFNYPSSRSFGQSGVTPNLEIVGDTVNRVSLDITVAPLGFQNVNRSQPLRAAQTVPVISSPGIFQATVPQLVSFHLPTTASAVAVQAPSVVPQTSAQTPAQTAPMSGVKTPLYAQRTQALALSLSSQLQQALGSNADMLHTILVNLMDNGEYHLVVVDRFGQIVTDHLETALSVPGRNSFVGFSFPLSNGVNVSLNFDVQELRDHLVSNTCVSLGYSLSDLHLELVDDPNLTPLNVSMSIMTPSVQPLIGQLVSFSSAQQFDAHVPSAILKAAGHSLQYTGPVAPYIHPVLQPSYKTTFTPTPVSHGPLNLQIAISANAQAVTSQKQSAIPADPSRAQLISGMVDVHNFYTTGKTEDGAFVYLTIRNGANETEHFLWLHDVPAGDVLTQSDLLSATEVALPEDLRNESRYTLRGNGLGKVDESFDTKLFGTAIQFHFQKEERLMKTGSTLNLEMNGKTWVFKDIGAERVTLADGRTTSRRAQLETVLTPAQGQMVNGVAAGFRFLPASTSDASIANASNASVAATAAANNSPGFVSGLEKFLQKEAGKVFLALQPTEYFHSDLGALAPNFKLILIERVSEKNRYRFLAHAVDDHGDVTTSAVSVDDKSLGPAMTESMLLFSPAGQMVLGVNDLKMATLFNRSGGVADLGQGSAKILVAQERRLELEVVSMKKQSDGSYGNVSHSGSCKIVTDPTTFKGLMNFTPHPLAAAHLPDEPAPAAGEHPFYDYFGRGSMSMRCEFALQP